MKPETAFELSAARGDYLHRKDGIVRGSLVESAEASGELGLKERFESVAERITEYAESQSDKVGVGGAEGKVSLPVVVRPPEGRQPQVSLRLQYVGSYSPDSAEDGFVNCYGDLVKSVQAEWIHGPEGVAVETRPNTYHDSELTEKFFGEVFATETLWQHEYEVAMSVFEVATGMVRVKNHAEERLTLLEQSVDAYELAWRMRWVDRLETLSVFGVEPYTEVALLDIHNPVKVIEVQHVEVEAGTQPGAETREQYEQRVYGRVLTSDEIEVAIAKLAEAEGMLSGQIPRELRGEVELLNDRRRSEVATLEAGLSNAKKAELQAVREAIKEDGFLKRKKDIEAWLGTRFPQALDNLRPIDVIALDDQYDKDTLMILVAGQAVSS